MINRIHYLFIWNSVQSERKNKIQTLEGKYRFGKKDIETNLKYTMTVYKLVE